MSGSVSMSVSVSVRVSVRARVSVCSNVSARVQPSEKIYVIGGDGLAGEIEAVGMQVSGLEC